MSRSRPQLCAAPALACSISDPAGAPADAAIDRGAGGGAGADGSPAVDQLADLAPAGDGTAAVDGPPPSYPSDQYCRSWLRCNAGADEVCDLALGRCEQRDRVAVSGSSLFTDHKVWSWPLLDGQPRIDRATQIRVVTSFVLPLLQRAFGLVEPFAQRIDKPQGTPAYTVQKK